MAHTKRREPLSRKEAAIKVAIIEIQYRSRRDVFDIYFLGDVHLGSALCDEEKLAATVEEIRSNPRALVFLMGDLAEYIPPQDVRWVEEERRGESIAEWVDRTDVGRSQAERVVETLTPIRRKVLGALQGNHELAIRQAFSQNVHQMVCEHLGIRDLSYCALVRLTFVWRRRTHAGHHAVDVLLHHGWGGGRTDSADVGRFNDLLRDYDADWYIAGHTHRYYAVKALRHYLHPQRAELRSKIMLYGRSGTFLKTVAAGKAGYAERTALHPVHTGCLRVTYNPEAQNVIVHV